MSWEAGRKTGGWPSIGKGRIEGGGSRGGRGESETAARGAGCGEVTSFGAEAGVKGLSGDSENSMTEAGMVVGKGDGRGDFKGVSGMTNGEPGLNRTRGVGVAGASPGESFPGLDEERID